MAGLVLIFDFDKTIIECDSDNWVVDNLGFTDLFNQLLPTMPWNSLMDRMMGEIHSNGISVEDIAQVLKHVPIHPRIVPAIKSAHALGCDLRIVSDANTFFIDIILDHLGIKDCFSEINTNPSHVDEHGRLRIGAHQDFKNSSHGCQLCPPNMCKGGIIERIQAEEAGVNKKRIIYLGDGAGDYCPSLKLNHGDFVMPRKNFPVWDLICRNHNLVRAQIHAWTDGEELEKVLLYRISKVVVSEEEDDVISGGRNQMVVDCKLQTISMDSHEAMGPSALPVKSTNVKV